MSEPLVLVTGGAGFIGSHLVEALLARGHAVRVLDDLSSGKRENLAAVMDRIDFRRGDVRDGAAVRDAVAGARFILHEAALVSVPASVDHPDEACDIIVRGTVNVLAAAREAGVKRVVMAGSSAAYGDIPESPKVETMAPRALSPYAAAKVAAEMFCQAYYHSYGLETMSLRYFNVFGPRQDPASQYAAVIPKFLDLLHAGRRPTIYGDGGQTRDFVHVDDVVQANLAALNVPATHGEIVNIAGGNSVSINDLLSELAGILGVPAAADYAPPRPGDVRESLAGIGRARRLLGYEPRVTLHDGLARLAAWWGEVRKV